MNNKPVAWIDPYDLERLPHHDCWVNGQEHKNSVPLYTHPAKELDEQFKKGFEAGKEEGWKAHKFYHPAKTLTDEEIEEFEWVIKKHFHFNPNEKVVGLDRIIRAILRKAQE